jgi:hypothetical protein
MTIGTPRRARFLIASVCLLLPVAACNGGDGSDVPTQSGAPTATALPSPTADLAGVPTGVAAFVSAVDEWIRSGDERSFYEHIALVPHECGTNPNDENTGVDRLCEGAVPGEVRYGILRGADTHARVFPAPDPATLSGPHDGVELPGDAELVDEFGAGAWHIATIGCPLDATVSCEQRFSIVATYARSGVGQDGGAITARFAQLLEVRETDGKNLGFEVFSQIVNGWPLFPPQAVEGGAPLSSEAHAFGFWAYGYHRLPR